MESFKPNTSKIFYLYILLFTLPLTAKNNNINNKTVTFFSNPPSDFLIKKAIFNGSLATTDNPARKFTVKLEMLNTKGALIGICSGIIIANKVILTNAHCFINKPSQVKINFGLDNDDPDFQQQFSNQYLTHPKFDLNRVRAEIKKSEQKLLSIDFANYLSLKNYYMQFYRRPKLRPISSENLKNAFDIGIVYLKKSIKKPFSPIRFAEQTMSDSLNSVYFAGFGMFGIKPKNIDDKLRFTQLEPISFEYKHNQAVIMISFPLFNIEGVMPGDSGGPAFIYKNNEAYLVGLNTRSEPAGIVRSIIPHYHFQWLTESITNHFKKNLEI